MHIDDILADMELLDDRMERYRYLVDLGKELTPLVDEERVEANRVRGCTSNVWLVHEVTADDPPRLSLRADSDAHIVKGLVALALALFSGKTAAEILAVDTEAVFARLDLTSQLTPSRQNGLYAVVARVRQIAAELAGEGT